MGPPNPRCQSPPHGARRVRCKARCRDLGACCLSSVSPSHSGGRSEGPLGAPAQGAGGRWPPVLGNLPESKTCWHAAPSPAACSHGSPAEDEPLCVPTAGIWGWSRRWEQVCFLLPPLRALTATWPRLGAKGRGRCPEAQAGCAVAQDSLLPCWHSGKNPCPQHPGDGGAGCVPRHNEHRAEGLGAGQPPQNPHP